ncbi:MAG TPA: hypothetical protein VKF35_09680 [Hyphomicrobiaceae bacterium]|nr:hypothetical protein [Hyphomicrobiaceae bacterium]
MVLATVVVVAWQHELRPTKRQDAVSTTSPRPEPRALTAEEESYAASLWQIHREVTPSAVAMSFAGIVYETANHDARQLERKLEPVAQFFGDAEPRLRDLRVPASLSRVHSQYVDALVLYRKASQEMLAFTRDGERQHLNDAHDMSVQASQDLLRVGEVLWPGQYKPH